MPTRDEIEEAREGARRGFAASRGGGDDADPEASARRLDVERWWMRRWRRGLLAHAHLEVEAKDRSGDVSARGGFEPDAAAVAAGEWPPQIPRSPATRKGPLPGGVDPEGILATVPLAADIVDALSREDTDEVGVAVEAVETLVAHGNGRFLLVPEAAKVIPTLIRHVATTARALERARANGGKLPPEEETREETKGDERKDETDGKEASEGREGRDGQDGGSNGAKKKKKKQPLTTANLCARNALLVHTLYSLTKEAELEREGSAWPTLLASTDELLPAFCSLLRPTPARRPDWPPAAVDSAPTFDAAAADADADADAGMASREMIGELGRNALIVLAEMSDPVNTRADPEAGARWAAHVIERRTDLIRVLVDVMALNRDANAKEDAKTADDEASARSTEGVDGEGFRLTATRDDAAPAIFAFPDARAAGDVVDADADASGPSGDFALTSDCAHIAAAAIFGMISWEPSLDALLDALESDSDGDESESGVAAFMSRTVALLADAAPNDGSGSVSGRADHSPLGGVEAAGLVARLAGHPRGRAALLNHAPGVIGYLIPCVRRDNGQTSAFAGRAFCGLARSEEGARLLLQYPKPEALVRALVSTLPAADGSDAAELERARRGVGHDHLGQVFSEVVIAIATLAQQKTWRWRILDVRSTAPESQPEMAREESADSAYRPVALVGSLTRLLADPHPEVVFNTLFCVNCLMGEPPQSWGRGRDTEREEDVVSRRALISAAARVAAEREKKPGLGPSLEESLAATLRSPPSGGKTTRDETRRRDDDDSNDERRDSHGSHDVTHEGVENDMIGDEGDSEGDSSPDCRLNATLVIANLAGDPAGRRALLRRGGKPLVDGVVSMLLGADADRAMLAAYSLGELARPFRDEDVPHDADADADECPLADALAFISREHIRRLSETSTTACRLVPGAGPPPGGKTVIVQLAESARRAAQSVLHDETTRRWVTRGDVPESERDVSDDDARRALLDLDLHVKRKWLVEMLRWENGPVSVGVPVQGLTGLTLICDREQPLEDLCRQCAPGKRGGVDGLWGPDGAFSLSDARVGVAGSFLMPPRGGINVKFRDEHGAGAAVRREYMSLVAESACDRSNLLFASHDGGATMHPNPVSGAVSERHLEYFAALGRLAAMALYHGETFPLRLTPAFCDRILGVPMRLDHLETVDPTLYKNQVRYVLDHGPEGLDLTWCDVADPTGVFSPGELAPLRDRDPDAEVTREDAPGYLRALVERRVVGSVRRQTASFAAGFGAVIPTPLLSRMRGLLNGRELSELIAGARTVDLDDWRRHTAYSDAPFSQTFTVWCFWRAMETFTAEERVAVLQFATGLSSAPAGGFRNLVGYMGDAVPFTLGELTWPRCVERGALPMAHACFNMLRLPRLAENAFPPGIEGREAGASEMARRVRIAVENGVRGFDDF